MAGENEWWRGRHFLQNCLGDCASLLVHAADAWELLRTNRQASVGIPRQEVSHQERILPLQHHLIHIGPPVGKLDHSSSGSEASRKLHAIFIPFRTFHATDF
jgi:hypothetical protein